MRRNCKYILFRFKYSVNMLIVGILLISFISCESPNKDEKPKTKSNDSVNEKVNKSHLAKKIEVDDTFDDDSLELDEILKSYIDGYKNIFVLDTSILFENNKMRISLKHYCLINSKLVIPSKYVSIFGLREFQTHEFRSELKVWSDKSILIDTIISKNMFKNYLSQDLDKYGVLLYPNFSFATRGFNIDYSVSIPLTDIGIAVKLSYVFNGQLKANIE